MNSWTFLLFYFLVRSSEINGDGDGCGDSVVKPLMLNGHYVKWPSQKMGDNFVRKNRYIPKNIIYTRFQLCANNVFLAAPRYRYIYIGYEITFSHFNLSIWIRFQLSLKHVRNFDSQTHNNIRKYDYCRLGVPFTLGKTLLINNRELQQSFDTYVKPYPCVDQLGTGKGSCTGGILVNVVDLVMGVDGILWVLDVGVSNTLDDHPSTDGDPKIVGFDVATGNVSRKLYYFGTRLGRRPWRHMW